MPGIMISGNNAKIGTDELLSIINQARLEHGEKPVRNNDFIPRVKDELEGEHYETFVVQNPNKTTTTAYLLNKDQCTLVAMRESKGVRRNVLDQLKQLQAAPTIPQTLPEALRLAADLAEQKAKVEQQLAIAAPKAEALDRIADTTGVFGIREAAKALKVKQSELVTLLIDRKWAYRDERQVLQGYSNRIDQGYIKHVMSAPIILNDGTERVFSQLKITSAGVTRLSQIISKTTKAA